MRYSDENMRLFPFERIREGQKDFLKDVDYVIRRGESIIAHVPTGIGKTAAVVSPSLDYSIKNNKTLFFLTPKHTQHTIVVDTLRKIKKRYGIEFITVDIIGKQWTCPHKVRDLDSREFNEFCRKMKKDERCRYYRNVRKRKLSKNAKKVIEDIKKEPMHAEKISSICNKNDLCPYEVCVEIGKEADVIICDYFHIFSPKIRKAFLSKLDKKLENSILIVDEAHNLPERVRKLLSNNLSDFQLKRAIKEANFLGEETLADDFRDLMKILKKIGKGMRKGEEKKVNKEEFIYLLEEKLGLEYKEFNNLVSDLGERVLDVPNRNISYCKGVSRFLERWDNGDLGYARILTKNRGFNLSYRCLDPSISTKGIFSSSYSSILMSGTMIPQEMYRDILGFDSNITLREYESPFPRENRLSIIVPGVTTRYSKRSDYMYLRYADMIRRINKDVPGNVAVFFPAYHILNSVRKFLTRDGTDKEVLIERRDMGKEDRVQLHNRLLNLMHKGGGLLLGVQAGSLSEGVDYANNLLDAVIIVGLPLETPNLEIKSLIEYYDFRFDRGWDYGYIFPAMNRVLQAAGRCIRSETDKGVIVLMDERFKWRNYSKCIPRDFGFIVSETPERYVKRFFGG